MFIFPKMIKNGCFFNFYLVIFMKMNNLLFSRNAFLSYICASFTGQDIPDTSYRFLFRFLN
ncbi:hypothetical protein HMPREF0204_12552 [Chryseobacterium gleum ATCC 35910]|uniref:Uncharacterized protein n=1 Tax=Chryseobacterium gleum ATCC 35910 TaxID=525257 RepID=A0ABP2ILM7_CHRGE|nr:hypothetical protein HMPREF0204_12552 [Chryseobacterium gleum ATCC 35910]